MAIVRKKGNKDARINYTHGNKLFERLDITRLRMLIDKVFPDAAAAQRGTSGLLMRCLTPTHEDKHPSFFISTSHNYARCYSCGYYTKNLLQMLQDTKGWSFKDAVQQIQGLVGFRVVTEKVEKDLEELDNHQAAYRVLFEVCNQHLTNCISPPTDSMDYVPAFLRVVQPTLDWLFVERGHNQDFAPFLPYGIFPPQHMIIDMATKVLEKQANDQYAATSTTTLTKDRREKILARLTELVKNVDGNWTHAVTYHTGYALTTPGRMRLRRPGDVRKSENMINLPGFGEDDPVGYLGLYSTAFSAFSTKETEKFKFILVEGENDMLTCQERILESGRLGVYVLASCGNANNTDALTHGGVSSVYLLHDHPDPDIGRGEEWLKLRLSSASEIEARVFTKWDELRQGNLSVKDPDDAVRNNGFDHFRRVVLDQIQTSFVASDVWAADRAIEEASPIDPSETRLRMQKAVEFGQCVRHPAQLATFIERMQQALGIPSGPLRGEIVKVKDTEAGFINRIAETIKHEFHTLYKEDNARGGTLHLFHKKTRREINFFMTDGDGMLAALSNVFGEMYGYFKDYVGLPPSYGDDNTEDLAHTPMIRERQKDLAAYLKIAMQMVYQGVPSKDECLRLGQGVHLLADPDMGNEQLLYVVNGKRCYLGRWDNPTTQQMTWMELPGPSHGRYLFDIDGREPWSREIVDVKDLDAGNLIPTTEVQGAIEDVFNIFNKNWRFVTQELDSTFLAYHLFACAVSAAFPTKVILSFIGQTQSGKSSAMAIFSGGQFSNLQLLEAVLYQSQYTMPALFQAFSGSSLMMALEEFSIDPSQPTHKSQQVENINEMLRQVIFDGGSVIRRGTAEGKTKTFRVHTNVATSSVNIARDPQDENRRYTIEMVKVDGLKDPAVGIFETVDQERFLAIRRIATLGMLKYARELSKHHDEIYREINQPKFLPFSVPSRFLRNFLPIASIMKQFGGDWRAFIVAVCESRRDKLAAVAKDTAPGNLLGRILHTPSIRIGATGRASVLSLMASEEEWGLINDAKSGFYFDDKQKLGVIDWVAITAPDGLLHRVDEYGKSVTRTLKHMLDQHPSAIKGREYNAYKVFDFLQTCKVVADEHEISVVRLDAQVARLRARAPEAKVEGPSLVIPSASRAGGNNNNV